MGPASATLKPQLPVTPASVARSNPPTRDDEDDDLELIDEIPIVEDEPPHRRWRRR